MSTQALVVEGRQGTQAMRRSWDLRARRERLDLNTLKTDLQTSAA